MILLCSSCDCLQALKEKGYNGLVVQAGSGSFLPPPVTEDFHLDCYDYKSSLRNDLQSASLVISHGGMHVAVCCIFAPTLHTSLFCLSCTLHWMSLACVHGLLSFIQCCPIHWLSDTQWMVYTYHAPLDTRGSWSMALMWSIHPKVSFKLEIQVSGWLLSWQAAP